MNNLEFTTTAICGRPEILFQTYNALQENINIDLKKCILYINIDKSPISKDYNSILDIANSFFGEVIYRFSNSSNFALALKWCWSNVKNKHFFNYEDDWLLTETIDLNILIDLLYSDDKVFAVNLRAYPFSYPKLCLLPSLYRKEYTDIFINKIKPDYNPERSLRDYIRGKSIYNLHYPDKIDKIILFDLGRKWMKEKGLRKNGMSKNFTYWCKK